VYSLFFFSISRYRFKYGIMEEPKSALPEAETTAYPTSLSQGTVTTKWQDALAELKYMLLTKDGWIGDYVCDSASVAFLTTY
jgi:hypothetical protein